MRTVETEGKTRKDAVCHLKRALDEITIEGVPTTIPFFQLLLRDEQFMRGEFTADFIEKTNILQRLSPQAPPKTIFKKEAIEKKDIAEMVFRIYQTLKESEPAPSAKKSYTSNWLMSERLKMFE